MWKGWMSCACAQLPSFCVQWRPSILRDARLVQRPPRPFDMSEIESSAVLEARGVQKNFTQGPVTLEVLQGVMLAVGSGERIAIVGASGSGKTTLLQILGGLDRPTTGHVLVDGQDIHELTEDARGMLRNRALGFVYQFHHLLPEFSALENVAMPLLVRRTAV